MSAATSPSSSSSSSSSKPVFKPSALEAFFIFNPLLGDEDTEGDKILFFAPSIDLNQQKDFIGMCEGLTNFVRDFAPEKLCDSIHCEKTRYSLFQAEPDYWFVLVVRNPSVTITAGSEKRIEYLDDELDDSVIHAIIKRAYHLYRLFNGRLTDIVAASNHAVLRESLESFMTYFLPTVRFNQLRFFTDIHGFQFLPVDKPTFLSVQFMANKLAAQFPEVETLAVMHKGFLIWSGIDQDDMFLLYTLAQGSSTLPMLHDYLATVRSPVDAAAADSFRMTEEEDAHVNSNWFTGPIRRRALSETPNLERAPRIFFFGGDKASCTNRIAIYAVHDVMVFIVLRDTQEEPQQHTISTFYTQMEETIQTDLIKIAKKFAEQAAINQDSIDDQFRFLYFNQLNLALKTSLNIRNAPLTMETIQAIRQIHSDFTRAFAADEKQQVQHSTSEVCVKTKGGGWVVGHRASESHREFFVVIDGRDRTIVDVQQEVDKLSRSYFYNIFIH